MGTFDKILDCVWPTVLVILTPLMVYGFFGQNAAYKEMYSKPSWLERRTAITDKAINTALERDELNESKPVREKEDSSPPKLYNPGDNNFNIPLEQLLEGKHGYF